MYKMYMLIYRSHTQAMIVELYLCAPDYSIVWYTGSCKYNLYGLYSTKSNLHLQKWLKS